MLRGDRDRLYPSTYQPMADYLAAIESAEAVLTFAQIEAILGVPLSLSAQTSPSWWSGTIPSHTRTWRALGWRAHLEQRDQRVRFTRDAVGDG